MGEKGGGWLGGGGEEGRTGPCYLQACSEFQVPSLCSDWRLCFLSHVEEGREKTPLELVLSSCALRTQTYSLWRGLSLGKPSNLFGFRLN